MELASTRCLPIALTLKTMLIENVDVWEKIGLARLPRLPADFFEIAQIGKIAEIREVDEVSEFGEVNEFGEVTEVGSRVGRASRLSKIIEVSKFIKLVSDFFL